MENELVKDFKIACGAFDDELRDYYYLAIERGAEQEDVQEIVDLMWKLNSLKKTTKADLESNKILLQDLKNSFEYKKAYIDAYLDERDAELQKQQEEDEEEEYEATVVDAKESTKSGAGRALATALGVIFLGGIAVHTGIIIHRGLNCEEQVEETESEMDKEEFIGPVEDSEEAEEESKEESTEESKEENKNLQPGEFGTFLDASDAEQVQARAQYLFDNYYAPNMKYIDAGDQHLVTVDNIANTIRVMNGELPLDENGYQTKDGATVDDYTSVLLATTVNAGSTKGEEYYHFPAYLFAEDGSEVQEFIKSYDDIYDKLVYSMNVGDDPQAEDAIACLGYKFWNEWYLQGMYGDTNPHTFDTDLRYFAFVATIEPYNTTALEYHLNEKKPVCIEACYDYETKNKELLSVNEIKVALETGEWNQISAKLAGMDVPNNPWLPLFWEALDDQLNWKYDHRDTLTLKNN